MPPLPNRGPHPQRCTTPAFSGWSACTKTCGTGAQSRTRSVTTAAARGANECPHRAETRDCHVAACAVDCANSCDAASGACATCTKSCGTGTQSRSRSGTKTKDNGGYSGPIAATTARTRPLRSGRSCPSGYTSDGTSKTITPTTTTAPFAVKDTITLPIG